MAPQLQLFGSPCLLGAGEPLAIPATQALLFAAYLACRDDWVARDELLTLFWPEEDEKTARHNLSQLLYHCKRQPWMTELETTRTRVRWDIDSDVRRFREAVAAGAWQQALDLHSELLLAGVRAGETAALQSWLDDEREALREAWRDAALAQTAKLEDDGRYEQAAVTLRELLRDDLLAEEAVQAYLRCAAHNGQREQALRTYQAFAAQLADELELEPLEQTRVLAAALRAGNETSEDKHAGAPPAATPPATPSRHLKRLPPDRTPFIGRERELAALGALLAGGEHRLITITGPGGVGKSRLATQAARQHADRMRDGGLLVAAFVPLAALDTAAQLPTAIADALGVPRRSGTPPLELLESYLADQELLLVLDNLEQLLAREEDQEAGETGSDTVAAVLLALLAAAPGVQLLLTSRRPLGLAGEALYPLGGMSVPNDDALAPTEASATGADESSDALRLFARSARRVQPAFTLDGAERAAAAALCRWLRGLPLGIELAAAWVRLLAPSEILAELQSDVDLLASNAADLPERHRSLRAVFESSWRRVAPGERDALARLAVFRGGFERDAAGAVADVGVRTLLALTNASLLQRTPDGRFERHPAVLAFTAEKLAADPRIAHEAAERHAAYYLALAREAQPHLEGAEQMAWLRRLADEEENLRAAFRHFLEAEAPAGEAAMHLFAALGSYWRRSGRIPEGRELFARLEPLAPKAPSPARAGALNAAGILASHQGELTTARAYHQEALAIAEQLADGALRADALVNLATIDWQQGDLERARERLEQAVALERAHGTEAGLAGLLNNLGNIARDQRRYDDALALFDEALEHAHRIGHLWEQANTTNNRAIVFAYRGDLESAGEQFAAALALQRQLGDRRGMSMSLTNLGNTFLDRGQHQRAAELFGEALELCRELGDRAGVAHIHNNLGILAGYDKRFDETHDHYREALRLRHQMGQKRAVALTLNCFVDLALLEQQPERALVLIGAIEALEEALGVPYPENIQQLYDDYRRQALAAVPAKRAKQLLEQGRGLELEQLVRLAAARGGAPGKPDVGSMSRVSNNATS